CARLRPTYYFDYW
nr:immunoglobulin heavy chain junction region [Mus musculus]MBK4184986.1 immunoglobulin heavy chain junction region [Mus musculus]MBK4184987.1 immunoglobulin heavy chain junction region [Mus musculus]